MNIKRTLIVLISLAILVLAALLIPKSAYSPEGNVNNSVQVPKSKVFSTLQDVTVSDLITYNREKYGPNNVWEDPIERNMLSAKIFAEQPFFMILSGPTGPASTMYQLFYVHNGELKEANVGFISTSLAGVWSQFGYNKKGDYFYQAFGSPSQLYNEGSVPCSFTKYVWDISKMEFAKDTTINVGSTKDDFCTDTFAEQGIVLGEAIYP